MTISDFTFVPSCAHGWVDACLGHSSVFYHVNRSIGLNNVVLGKVTTSYVHIINFKTKSINSVLGKAKPSYVYLDLVTSKNSLTFSWKIWKNLRNFFKEGVYGRAGNFKKILSVMKYLGAEKNGSTIIVEQEW